MTTIAGYAFSLHLFLLQSANVVLAQVGLVRYFEDQNDAERKAAAAPKKVCKHCGAEGEHETRDCPVIIVSLSIVYLSVIVIN